MTCVYTHSYDVKLKFYLSQLHLNSTTEDRPTDASRNVSEEESDDEKKLKWTPFPPPNMEAIIGKMPRVLLTMEQLCAPISDDEEEEEEEKKENDRIVQESEHKQDEHFVVPSESTCTTSTVTNSTDEGATTGKSGERPGSVNTGKTVSDFIKSNRIDHGHTGGSRDPQRKNQAPTTKYKSGRKDTSKKSETPVGNVIDLTGSSNQPSTSRHHSISAFQSHRSTSSTAASSPASQSIQPPCSSTDHFELQDDEDFDVLCTGVDLDAIDDFSDEDDAEVAPSLTHNTYHTTSGKGKSRYIEEPSVRWSPERLNSKGKSSVCGNSNLKDARSTSSAPTATSSRDRSATKHGVGQPSVTHSSATVDLKQSFARVKRSNDVDIVSRAKIPRLENTKSASLYESPESTEDHRTLHRHTNHDTELHSSTPHTVAFSDVPRANAGSEIRPQPTTRGLMRKGTVSGGASSLTVHGTANKVPQENTTPAQATTAYDRVPRTSSAPSVQMSTPHSTLPATSRHQVAGSGRGGGVVAGGSGGGGVVAGSGRGGGVGWTTPLGSRLTTENCPICNEKFSSW